RAASERQAYRSATITATTKSPVDCAGPPSSVVRGGRGCADQPRMSRRLSRSRSTVQPSGQRLSTKRTRPSARSETCPSPTSAQNRVARCHLSCPSISATEAPKRWRMPSFRDLTSLRLPFRSCTSPKCRRSSINSTNGVTSNPVAAPLRPPPRHHLLQGLLHLPGLEEL